MPSILKENIAHEKVHMNHQGIAIDLLHFHRYADQSGCQFHWHEQLEFYYVYQGGLSLICNGEQDWLSPGDIGFVNWCQPHRGYRFLDDTKYYVIKIDFSLLKDCFSEAFNVPYTAILIQGASLLPTFIQQDHILAQYFITLIEELSHKKMGYEMAVKSMVQLIITHILRLSTTPITIDSKSGIEQDTLHHIHHILHYISENYTNYITLDELAISLGLSKAYMCRIFKKHTQHTILTYINELKCSHAASLILNGMPLLDVCEEVGFKDYNYFSRLFKKIYNQSPYHYKNDYMTDIK